MLKKCFQVKELRNKLLYTVFMLVLFRLGCALTVPFADGSYLSELFYGGSIFSYLDMVSGGALGNLSVFALGASPYINASIVLQLLTVAIDPLRHLQKDDNEKYQKIMQYVSLGFSVCMAIGVYAILTAYGAVTYTTGTAGILACITIIVALIAGAQVVTFIAWEIDDKGIGNGLSLIIFAGVISRWSSITSTISSFISFISAQQWGYVAIIGFIPFAALVAIYFTVVITNAEKRVPVQYASPLSRGAKSFIPVKLIMSGVMPIIFASSIMSLPQTIAAFIPDTSSNAYALLTSFTSDSWIYCIVYIILIYFFNYFYIEVQFDAIEIANNLRSHGGTIPGIRAGESTVKYLEHAAASVAALGSTCLALVAAVPIIFGNLSGLSIQLGGTSLLIICGVILESVRTIDSYITVRHHKGFLD